jgi:hypothetical protein
MCQVLAYEIQVPSGKILQRLTAKELKGNGSTRWLGVLPTETICRAIELSLAPSCSANASIDEQLEKACGRIALGPNISMMQPTQDWHCDDVANRLGTSEVSASLP